MGWAAKEKGVIEERSSTDYALFFRDAYLSIPMFLCTEILIVFSGSRLRLGASLEQPLDSTRTVANAPEQRPEPKAHALDANRVDKEVHKSANC